MTHYEVLQVSEVASTAIITAAYKELSRIYHPDLAHTGNAEMMRKINEARDVLTDDVRRRAYDFELDQARTASANATGPEYQQAYPDAYPPSMIEFDPQQFVQAAGEGILDHVLSQVPGPLGAIIREAKRKAVEHSRRKTQEEARKH